MRTKKLTLFISILSIIYGMILVIYPPAVFSFSEAKAAALVVIIITFWVTGIIPEYLTAILFFIAAMVFSISSADIVFSGFQSAAFWLVFGGLIIGIGINSTGLGKRIAEKVSFHLDGSYFKLIGGLVLLGLLFSFLMPSGMGRVLLLIPVATAISKNFGFDRGSNGFTGVILAVVLGSFIPAFSILPANVPNMILVGMTESLFEYSPLYGEYLVLHFPVLGILKAAIITFLIIFMYPDSAKINKKGMPTEIAGMSQNEKCLSFILFVLLTLWITDYIHHISPAWIALTGALVLLFPKVEIVSQQQFNEKMNYGSLIFIAGIMGVGSMINHSGVGAALAKYLIPFLPLDENSPFLNFISLSVSSMLTGIFTTAPGVPAIITPFSNELSQASGFPIKSVFMIQVLGFSTTLFPYQTPPILIGMQVAGVNLKEAFKVCFFLAIISVLLLLPLNYLWWQILGWL